MTSDGYLIEQKLPISEATKRKNPDLFSPPPKRIFEWSDPTLPPHKEMTFTKPPKRIRQSKEPNQTEKRWVQVLRDRGYVNILEQKITLALDPPFTSYRPDVCTIETYSLEGKNPNRIEVVFYEVKSPHRFARAGIAKVALAAKTYPKFKFVLAMWEDGKWTETNL